MRWLLLIALSGAALVAGPAVAGEESAVVQLVNDSARAMSELPKTRDPESVLKFYAPDYRGITDGEWQTRENVESVVSEIQENVRGGNSVRIMNQTENVRAEVSGNVAWSVYDFYSKIEVLGQVLGEVKRRCTGIYGRSGSTWKIRHEHCSTTWAAPPPPEDGAEDVPDAGPLEG